jgi:hypothetical protein
MRKAALVLGPLGLLFAGSIFACENDGNVGGGPDLSLDGGAPSFDAGQQPPIDGSVPDVAPDAPPGPPSVTVTVTDRNGPKGNVRVVFHDAAGAVLETKLTGADGKASSAGALPAMASALLGSGYDRHIVTWTGVENGDDLAVKDVEPENDETVIGSYNVTLIGQVADQNAYQYDIYAGSCGTTFADTATLTGSLNLYKFCVGSQSSVLVRAVDDGYTPIAHSFKKANPVPTDGGAVAVATGEWKPSATLTITATGVPA